LTVTSFGESVVLLDDGDEALFPIMLYTDPRGKEECGELCALMDEREIFERYGHRPHAMYSLPKLMYLRKHHAERFARVRRILPIASFLVYHLCGEAVTDYSLASRTMLLDIRRLAWGDEVLAIAGITRDVLPRVVSMGSVAGTVRAGLAEELGLRADTKIVMGCHDQIAAVIGAGAMKARLAVCGSGTVECITPVFDGIPKNTEAMFENGYAMVPALNGMVVTYAFVVTGGALLQWYRNRFAAYAKEEAEKSGKSLYAVLDGQVKGEPSGLLALPHFAGAATPYMDTNAKGAIIGLTLETDESDVYRALLEGVAYESRVNLERLRLAGVEIDRLRATGGGAKSAVWLRIKADILNRPIETLSSSEAGTVGSIMLAGLADGVYASLDEAMSLAGVKEQITPSPDSKKYDEIFARYAKVYGAVKEIMRA